MSNDAPFGELRNAQGERLDYACAAGAGPEQSGPLVVIGHGVTANKDRAWAVALAGALSKVGFANLRFSFSGNGSSDGDFRQSTVTKEVADLGAVLDAVASDERPICYVGHSMGGAVGVLRAATDERIRWLVSLAGMVNTHDFAQRKFGDLTPDKDRMWDKSACPLSVAFMDDMAKIQSVLPQAGKIRVPWLLVHGIPDTVVPVSDSREVRAAATACPTKRLVEIDGADHLFSGEHEAAMTEAVVSWFGEQTA